MRTQHQEEEEVLKTLFVKPCLDLNRPPKHTDTHVARKTNVMENKRPKPPPPTVSLKEFFRLSALMFCAAYNSMAYVFFFYTILGKTWDFFLFELKLNM